MSVRLHNNVSRSVCPTPQLCNLTPILTAQNKQTITSGKPPPHPVAAARSMTSRTASNGRPNIPPNRPNVQPMQFQKDMKNGTNNVNKLRDKQIVMGMHINSNPRPRGKFQ